MQGLKNFIDNYPEEEITDNLERIVSEYEATIRAKDKNIQSLQAKDKEIQSLQAREIHFQLSYIHIDLLSINKDLTSLYCGLHTLQR